MPLEIPGYYFDAERNKYFKIEKTQTAPSSAQWSSESVKRRREEEEASLLVQSKRYMMREHIKRHGLRRDVLTGGKLARECDGEHYGWAAAAAARDFEEYRAAAWAGGVVSQGAVSFVPSMVARKFGNMPCFYVAGEESNTEVGLAYTTIEEEILLGTYLEPDENGRIGGSLQETRTMGIPGSPWMPLAEMVRCPQMSSIAYHKPSHRVLLSSRDPDQSCGLFMFSPPISTAGGGNDDDHRRRWMIGQADHYQRIAIRPRSQPQQLIHRCTAAPSASPLLCIMGTNSGLLSVNPNGTTMNVSAPSGSSSSSSLQSLHGARSRSNNNNSSSSSSSGGIGEVFDQDFSVSNHNIAFAGGRRPRFWITDLRTSDAKWSYIRTESSVAHIRSVNEHQVLVAGLQNSMALYDLRFLPTTTTSSCVSSSTSTNRYKPLVKFPEYKNAAHVHTGFDISTKLNIVASALDDGTVKLFSLRSGCKLSGGSALQGIKTEAPIKALQFQKLPGEKGESLFVAEGTQLKKYSFGRGPQDD